MAYVPNSGSVVAFQSDATKLQVGASIIGLTPVNITNTNLNVAGSVVATQGTNPWIVNSAGSVAVAIVSGSVAVTTGNSSVQVLNFPTTQNVSGSVVATQGTSPWVVNFQNSSVLAVPVGSTISYIQNSVATVIIGGSIAASFTPPANQSVSGTVNIAGNPSISGTVQVGNFPTNQNVSGSVVAFVSGTVPVNTAGSVVSFQGTSPWVVNFQNSSIFANVTNTNLNVGGSVIAFPTGNQSVSGTVGTTQQGTWISSIVNTVPSSVIVGTSIFGQLPAGTAPLGSVAVLQGTLPWAIAGSVAATIQGTPNVNTAGSVVAFISGTPNVNTAGSVVAFQGTNPWVIQSIVGTYAEDAGHTTADKGIAVWGVRNDTIASFVSADLDYTPNALDSAGRTVIKPFAPEDGTIISYNGSVVSTSVTLIQASVTGKRSYITDFWISNTGNNTTLVTFQGGDTSVVGYGIAPAGGGEASPGIAIPLKTTLSQDLAFQAATATSVLYLTLKGYQAP